jgi:2'-5' RNA ligase
MPPPPDRQSPPTVRAFIAINLDPPLREAVALVQERLKAAGGDVAWVKPDNLHLTLKFLGQVEAGSLEAIARALASAAAEQAPFRLALAGVGAFPRVEAARVIWVGVTAGAETLGGLQAAIEARLEAIGIGREARPFAAHLTVGRVRSPRRRHQLAVAVTSLSREPVGEMVVARIDLMQSDLHATGARYSRLGSFSLGGAA